MTEQWLEEANEIASNVARQIHGRYAVYFDASDIKQELLIWAMKRQSKIKEWLNPEQDTADRKGGIRQCAKAMQREADKYCRNRKAKAVGYETRDEAFYNLGVIEQLIAHMDEIDEQKAGMQIRVSGGGSDPATGGNFLISVIDVRAAMEKLDPQDQLILEMRYQENLTLGQIANTFELSDTTIHRRIQSSLKRMMKELGGESPWIYTPRRVMSNSQAQAIVSDNN
jgi:RNA polymerase sigma factor (sigma-70 family)